MGFFRKQEEKLAARLLRWQMEKTGTPPPSESELNRLAAGLVTDAHEIARKSGQNFLLILKELIRDLRKGD